MWSAHPLHSSIYIRNCLHLDVIFSERFSESTRQKFLFPSGEPDQPNPWRSSSRRQSRWRFHHPQKSTQIEGPGKNLEKIYIEMIRNVKMFFWHRFLWSAKAKWCVDMLPQQVSLMTGAPQLPARKIKSGSNVEVASLSFGDPFFSWNSGLTWIRGLRVHRS